MNERIKELAEQARKYARDYVADCKHYGYYMEHNEYELRFEEKFTELIVKECFKVALVEGKGYLDPIKLRDAMKKHFGVEE